MKSNRFTFTLLAIVARALLRTGISLMITESGAFSETRGSEVQRQTPHPKTTIPQVPGFADRSKIPASGKQGPPANAATLFAFLS